MKATDKIWKKVMGDADQTMFTDVQPLLKKLDEADKVIAQLKIDLARERASRIRYGKIVDKTMRLIGRSMEGPHERTDINNVDKHLELFETYIHKILLGIDPKEKE